MFKYIFCILAFAAVTGCNSGTDTNIPVVSQKNTVSNQCMKDIECKGDRICEKGTCVSPKDPKSLIENPSAQESIITSQEKLPFIGEKEFKMYDGNNHQSIKIDANGDTVIIFGTSQGESDIYRGKFSNPMKSADGDEWLVKGNKIYKYRNGKPDTGCIYEENEKKPCVAEFD